ncbi:MAG: NAD(P)H-binding protein [Candidatus Obscuribacterales bacterium]|nr:NAD(P)H-binding protein [Candidatus Obscuribacterales bacterium]
MILVVGATGTVGLKVVDALVKSQQGQIRILARGKNDWTESVLPRYRRSGVDVIVGDIRNKNTVAKAVADCKAIVNCAGVMRAIPGDDLETVNVDGAANLIEAGKKAGVQRFIQLSCLGATEHSTSLYFGCKFDAEELVKESGLYWTIFRPSLIFDEESALIRILEFWVARAPFTVVVGSGLNRFQPVSATDVANCISQSLYDKDTVGKTYDLVGPDTIDLQTLLSKLAESRGLQLRGISIPSFIGVPLAGLLGKLNPKCPIDNNVMSVMTSELISDDTGIVRKFKITDRLAFDSCLKAIESNEEEDEPDDDNGSKSKSKSKSE